MSFSTTSPSLSTEQRVLAPMTAWAAVGQMEKLEQAIVRALDAGLSISAAKEALVQLYAYAGFPRSLNALGLLMKLLQERKARGVQDAPGKEAGPVLDGAQLLALGTDNQTRLSGAPVKGPLFEFAPAIDRYLKQHLFGALFARDNLSWQSREVATLGMLSALEGVQSQLQAHMRIALNTGLSPAQLRELTQVLASQVTPEAGARATAALEQVLSDRASA